MLAGLLVLAGFSSAVAPSGSGSGTPTGGAATSGADAAGGTSGTGDGTVSLYVSDERNAIGDFEHLNLTVGRVSFRRVDDGAEDRTGTPAPTVTTEFGETPEPGSETGAGEGDAEWVTREVDAATVDLAALQGENATLVSRFGLPNGTYTEVRLGVTEVDATLESGESVRVKLPSNRLRLGERFVVGNGQERRFVFDATVFEAGTSGEYVLKPVASESGTGVPIREVVPDDGREGRLGARFLGSVEPGEATTVAVTHDGEPVTGATVEVGERTYRTGSDGTVMFDVPADVEELEVEIAAGDAEAELTRTFGNRGKGANAGQEGSGPPGSDRGKGPNGGDGDGGDE